MSAAMEPGPVSGSTVRTRLTHLARPLGVPAFRRLWAAQAVSELGDWAARVALSVLVYTRTGSPAMAGLVTAVSLLPWLGAGQLLTSASERLSRRTVLVTSDLVRAGAFAVAALPLPVPVLLAVVFVAGLATPPFEAARSSLRPELLPPALFGSGIALTSVMEDLSVAVGSLLGGGLLAVLGAEGALLANAGSFALSALLLLRLPKGRRPRTEGDPGGLRLAARALLGDAVIRRAVLLVNVAMLAGTGLTAMCAPLVLEVLHRGAAAVGVLLALSAGVSILVTALLPLDREPYTLLRLAALLTVVGGGGLVLAGVVAITIPALRPAAVVSAFVLAGLLFTVLAPANVVVAPRLPLAVRASAYALLMGALVAGEAAGAALAGLAAAAIGVLPMCLLLGLPAASLGAVALATSRPRGAEPVLLLRQRDAGRAPQAPAMAGDS